MPHTSTVGIAGFGSLPAAMVASARLRSRPHFVLPYFVMPHFVMPVMVMPLKKTSRFPRAARLLRHADFERVYKQGRRHFSASLTVFYWARPEASAESQQRTMSGMPSGRPAPRGLRIGFTVGRALGGAVQRNRMKRRLREAVRMTMPPLGIAADVVMNPKKTLLTNDFTAVVNEISRAFVVIEQRLSGQTGSASPMSGKGESKRPAAARE